MSDEKCACGHLIALHYRQPGHPPTCIHCGCEQPYSMEWGSDE